MPPDWQLINRLSRIVAAPRWGGGVHRDHLAELAGVSPGSAGYGTALAVAYRMRRVDFCGSFVIPGRGLAESGDRATMAP